MKLSVITMLEQQTDPDEVFYLCGYVRPDVSKRVARNIPPTKCIIRNGQLINLKTTKMIRHIEDYSAINLADSLNLRCVYLFTTESEAEDHYTKAIKLVIEQLEEWKKIEINHIENEIENLKKIIS